MVRIRRFGVIKTATVVAVMYLLIIGVIFVPIAVLVALFRVGGGGDGSMNASLGFILVAVLAALFYSVLGWVFTAIACVVYNIAAGMVGGIELKLETEAAAPPPPAWGPVSTPTPTGAGPTAPPQVGA